MGTPGGSEIIVILIFILGLPLLFYYLGKRSGYKQGQLDMYKKIEEERKRNL